ncbi:tRNA (5-methylaminomethyl-2-thiouridine)(34)-methyltransferase MnmD [Polaribacter sp. MSW13]|uniref:tRNA (5-methylaminomethyl-2-thiouridine)(34)-methyltransferase MnmD n=1 Tax=Polaribacter marinus TaxID=2916838 RepID=A0A9X1VMU6_9FLAO|nr:tRNA (5-methylaminomethyl-2-thiouridine)(34)-methyltransferase MnmD [Polaribacter marinus]
MKREILITSDGSSTIHLPDWDEQYHSKNGSINETYHVFIESGLKQVSENKVSILEIGFGTGLNCFITYLEAKKEINYVGVEAYPVTAEEVEKMNFISILKAEKESENFQKMHAVSWEEKHQISKTFSLTKRKQFFEDIEDKDAFNLIYFDAFGARVQPQLWTEEIFQKMFEALKENGVLVTYSAKGSVRRAMQAVGFIVERLPGPPGKREMLRATKKSV